MRSEPSPTRSRTRGQRTATGPMPVMISRSGRCPWRTSRARPSSVSLSACMLSKAATSASTACASSARAPLRKTSVSGSAKVPDWVSWKTLVSVTAYHSFGGEVGGFEHPHDTPPSYPFMPSPTFADSSALTDGDLNTVSGGEPHTHEQPACAIIAWNGLLGEYGYPTGAKGGSFLDSVFCGTE